MDMDSAIEIKLSDRKINFTSTSAVY